MTGELAPKGLIILDRDGVINRDSREFVKNVDEWRPLPGSIGAIADLSKAGYTVAVASNQSGLARGLFDRNALRAMHRTLRPGGRSVVLEFSHPVAPGLQSAYDVYSFKILPLLGQIVAEDADSYRYLAESIRMHPDQETLLEMMSQAGFERCEYFNLTGGIVAVHRGYKF